MKMNQLSLFKPQISPVEILPDDNIVIRFSGGKDSLLSLILMRKRYPQHKITVTYSDTGFEHPGLWEYIQNIAAQLVVDVIKIDSPGLFNQIHHYGYLPSNFCRYCTSNLKRDPSNKVIRQMFPAGRVILVFGFRAEESATRANRPAFIVDPRMTTKNRTVMLYAPIHSWTEGEVKEAINAEGFELFHTYQYLSRLSCRVCFLAGKRDQEAVQANDPEGFEAVRQLKYELQHAQPAESGNVIPLRKAA